MSALGERIRNTLSLRGLSQAELARMVGCKQQTISYIVTSGSDSGASRYTTKIAEVLGVNPAWLATGEGSPTDPSVPVSVDGKIVRAKQVPVLVAGEVLPFLSGREVEPRGFLMVEEEIPQCFALEVEGNSMAPAFKPGDKVVIDPQVAPEPGDYVAAVAEGVILFRRFRVRGRSYELVPENTDWSTIQYSDGVKIIGTMVEHRTYRKRT